MKLIHTFYMLRATTFVILIFQVFTGFAQQNQDQGASQLLFQLQSSKPDTARVATLQSIMKFYFHKRGNFKKDLDSALYYGQQAISLSDSLRNYDLKNTTLLLIGETFFIGGNYPKGKESFLEGVNGFHNTSKPKLEGRALLILSAKAMFYESMHPELIDFSKKALEIFKQLNDRQGIMNSYMIIGALYNKLNLPDSASNNLLKALAIAETVGGRDKFKVFIALCDFYRNKGDSAKALLYAFDALKDLQDRHVPDTSPEYVDRYLQIASIYESFDRHQSYKYYNETMKSALIIKNEHSMYQFYEALQGLVNVMVSDGKPKQARALANKYIHQHPPVDNDEKVMIAELYGTCYEAMHEDKLAEKYYLQEIELSKGNPSQEQSARSSLARFYSSTKQFKKNIYYLKNAGKPKEAAPFMNRVLEELQYARIDSANGNYLSALNHYRQYKALTDTMFKESKAKQLYDLDIKYESKEKEQAIKLLKSESKNQRADLQKANLQKNITFAGIGILVMFSSLIAYGYAQKQHGNRILLFQKTEIDRKNQSLGQLNITQQKLLTEKEWLLKEIHHRVKNNMQVTMSLLAIQTHATTSKVAKEALANGQRRLHSMSLIHQKLYQSEKLSFIEMSNYISEMVSYLKDSFNFTSHILFKINAQKLELDIAQAVPIGLILNEAITNAIKHAFPGNIDGEIKVTLTATEDGYNQLIIADNGIGLPCDHEKLENKSLGMEIFKMLSKQIDGELCINGKNGTSISITFKPLKVMI